MVLEGRMEEESWVKREYRRGLRTHPFGVPVFRMRVDDVQLPVLKFCCLLLRKSSIHVRSELPKPRLLSL